MLEFLRSARGRRTEKLVLESVSLHRFSHLRAGTFALRRRRGWGCAGALALRGLSGAGGLSSAPVPHVGPWLLHCALVIQSLRLHCMCPLEVSPLRGAGLALVGLPSVGVWGSAAVLPERHFGGWQLSYRLVP